MSLTAIILLAASASAAPPAVFTNEEEVYFDVEAKQTPAPWIGVRATGTRYDFIDQFGKSVAPPAYRTIAAYNDGAQLTLTLPNGRQTELRRARPVTCWASLKKDTPKADGSEDWYFVRDARLHDQGGRVLIGDGIAGVKPVVLRMRNVTWRDSARSSNRPSLVLYVHTPDQPDHAVSYVWADPGAARLGVNLRWMQASCTVDGLDRVGTGSETKAN